MSIPIDQIRRFLTHIVESDNLGIKEYFPQLDCREPYFLVAATGLGKTVALPLHSLIQHLELLGKGDTYGFQLWVIVPTIAIAQALYRRQSQRWADWLEATLSKPRQRGRRQSSSELFGINTSQDKEVRGAIVFATSGIFSIYAREQCFQADRNAIVIDEAHTTLEAGDEVELGVALCRKQQVPVHFMSATVDTTGLREQLGVKIVIADRKPFPIWKHTTQRPMEECALDALRDAFIEPNLSSEYFPSPHNYPDARRVRAAVTETGRAKGFLFIVGTITGEQSDTARLQRHISPLLAQHGIPLLVSNRKVNQDRVAKAEYDQQLETIKAKNQRYVVIASSAVEMGVTFPNLDFVMTTDSGFAQVEVNGALSTQRLPLKINSLLQRIGRVGRERPGIAYITSDEEAPYSLFTDDEINDPKRLMPERIGLPMTRGPLLALAYALCAWAIPEIEIEETVQGLKIPSFYGNRWDERALVLCDALDRLLAAGVATLDQSRPDDKEPCYRLTAEGEALRWLFGRLDVICAVQAARALERGNSKGVLSWIVLAAVLGTPLKKFLTKNGEFLHGVSSITSRAQGLEAVVKLRGCEITIARYSDAIALHNVLVHYAKQVSKAKSLAPQLRREFFDHVLDDDCYELRIDKGELLRSLDRMDSIFELIRDTWSEKIDALFGHERMSLSELLSLSDHQGISISEAESYLRPLEDGGCLRAFFLERSRKVKGLIGCFESASERNWQQVPFKIESGTTAVDPALTTRILARVVPANRGNDEWLADISIPWEEVKRLTAQPQPATTHTKPSSSSAPAKVPPAYSREVVDPRRGASANPTPPHVEPEGNETQPPSPDEYEAPSDAEDWASVSAFPWIFATPKVEASSRSTETKRHASFLDELPEKSPPRQSTSPAKEINPAISIVVLALVGLLGVFLFKVINGTDHPRQQDAGTILTNATDVPPMEPFRCEVGSTSYEVSKQARVGSVDVRNVGGRLLMSWVLRRGDTCVAAGAELESSGAIRRWIDEEPVQDDRAPEPFLTIEHATAVVGRKGTLRIQVDGLVSPDKKRERISILCGDSAIPLEEKTSDVQGTLGQWQLDWQAPFFCRTVPTENGYWVFGAHSEPPTDAKAGTMYLFARYPHELGASRDLGWTLQIDHGKVVNATHPTQQLTSQALQNISVVSHNELSLITFRSVGGRQFYGWIDAHLRALGKLVRLPTHSRAPGLATLASDGRRVLMVLADRVKDVEADLPPPNPYRLFFVPINAEDGSPATPTLLSPIYPNDIDLATGIEDGGWNEFAPSILPARDDGWLVAWSTGPIESSQDTAAVQRVWLQPFSASMSPIGTASLIADTASDPELVATSEGFLLTMMKGKGHTRSVIAIPGSCR